MKKCTKCGVVKDFGCFYKKPPRPKQRSQYVSRCKSCRSKIMAELYQRKKGKYSKVRKEWYQSNTDNWKKYYYNQPKEKTREKSAKRRAAKLLATPSWLSEDDLKRISIVYGLAGFKSFVTGTPHEVDHIVPLQGKNVCGLHVPWNLQILTKTENARKFNKLEE